MHAKVLFPEFLLSNYDQGGNEANHPENKEEEPCNILFTLNVSSMPSMLGEKKKSESNFRTIILHCYEQGK